MARCWRRLKLLDRMRLRYGDILAVSNSGVGLRRIDQLALNVNFIPPPRAGLGAYLGQPAGHRIVRLRRLQYAPESDLSPFEVCRATSVITEATFGVPVFRHAIRRSISRTFASVARFPERAHLVGA